MMFPWGRYQHGLRVRRKLEQLVTETGALKGEGKADWDVEAYFKELDDEGMLDAMRAASLQAFFRKKAQMQAGMLNYSSSVEDNQSAASEAEDWDRWTSSAAETASTCTESEWSCERGDSEGNAPAGPVGVAGRWGFKQFVSVAQPLVGISEHTSSCTPSQPPRLSGLSGSCDSLPFIDECSGDQDDDQLQQIQDSELDEFLDELEQNENTEASTAAGTGWRHVMNRSTDTMLYCSWFREPGCRGGTEYRGRMIIHGCSAERARDFFLDEEYRGEWDENRAESDALEDWDENGCTALRWVRRLPFFLRNREYVVARRVWNPEERTFYCISRHANHPAAPRKPDLIRVSSFHSSWRIRPYVASEDPNAQGLPEVFFSGEGEAVEVITHHEEESGLQKDLARMGVARGMWSHMVKMEQALHSYVASGRNVRHILPIFLIRADIRVHNGLPPTNMPSNRATDRCGRDAGKERPVESGEAWATQANGKCPLEPVTPPLLGEARALAASPLQLPAGSRPL